MTSTNINPSKEAVSAFQGLGIDERLAVLAYLYTQISSAIPANAKDIQTQNVTDLVTKVQQLSGDEQLFALRDLLPAQKTDQDEIMLDPNPSKALVELVKGGGTKIPTHEYGTMKPESKLAFWYSLAQKLGSQISCIPKDYKHSAQATQVLNLLESMNTDELVAFLQQVL